MKKSLYSLFAFTILLTSLFFKTATNQQIFHKNQIITLDRRSIAANEPSIEENFESQKSFVSPIHRTNFKFTALGFQWNQDLRENTEIEFFLRYRDASKKFKKGDWSKWIKLQPNIDEKYEKDERGSQKTAFLPINPADAFQYQVLLGSDGKNTPTVSNVKITALHAEPKQHIPKHQIIAATAPIQLNSERVKIISRLEWGADESIRLYKLDRPKTDLVPIDGEYLEKFADELTIVKKITHTPDGQELTWPLQYPDKVSKIIIHHTASTSNLDNPEQAIRNIYHWHAIGRGWGDMGYNYLIDTEGRIYEGRYGGEGTVGAHAGKSNVGSIGIGVLGNYEENDISEKALISLMQLIGEKAKVHGIDPNGKSLFRGEIMENVLGHRDVMSTSCPGKNIYEKLMTIRTFSDHDLQTTQEANFFKVQKGKGYDYEDESKLYYVSLDPQKSKAITIILRNTGSVVWDQKTTLLIQNGFSMKDFFQYEAKANFQNTVGPGDSGSFILTMTGGIKPSYQILKIAPFINGKTKLEKFVLLPVNITAPIWNYEFIAAKWPKSYLKRSEQLSGWIELKNTGNVAWNNQGNVNIRLGTDHPRDRKSLFLNPPDTRIAFLQQKKVAPGEIGRFVFSLTAPMQSAHYKEYLTPVVEGVTWFADKGLNFETYIYEKLYNSSVIGMGVPMLKPDESKKAWMKIKNTGGKVWGTISFQKIGAPSITMTNFKMLEEKVKPGQTATIEFDIQAPKKIGTYQVFLRAKVNKININQKLWKIPVTVKKQAKKKEISQLETEKGGNKIRVLLAGFEGNPEIRSAEKMQIQVGKNIVAVIPGTETVKINHENGQYFIQSMSYNDVSDEPVRLVPENSDGILEIKNYERRPEWNKSLNDNEFRSTLEIRFIEGKLRVINELPIESYLKGLAETPNTDPLEKTKAIIVGARTYAYYYSNIGQKFPGKSYHLDDDPDHTQKYRGYGYEKRSPNTTKAVEQTRGILVTYNGQPVLTPYFSQSDGRTRSAQEVWGWTNTPYLISVDDPYCKGKSLLGHGVGMSGCGAYGMAQAGKTYDDILHYYYQGIVLKKEY